MATTEERVRQLAAENLPGDAGQEINLDASVAESSYSSVAIVQFVMLVGEKLSVELPPADVAKMNSLRDLINYIDSKSG